MCTLRRSNHARAPEGADGTCRNQRRPRDRRRPGWARPVVRANRGLNDCVRLIDSTLLEVAACRRQMHRRPVRTWRKLYEETGRLYAASNRFTRTMRDLGRAADSIARHPETAGGGPGLITELTVSWVEIGKRLAQVIAEVFTFHDQVFLGLETGALVPERPFDRRMQFVLALLPVPFRDFLSLRQPRVVDRIASILRRRRRTPRPAALPVPLVTHQGRAPPLFPVCPL